MIAFRERRAADSETSEFKHAIKMMQKGLDMICELTEEMEDRYSERSGHYRDDDDDMLSYRERRGYDGRRGMKR